MSKSKSEKPARATVVKNSSSESKPAQVVEGGELVEEPKSNGELVLHYILVVFEVIVRIFKAICQLIVIFYQFVCLYCQYPNATGYVFKVTYRSLLLCYQTGLWDPFDKKPAKEVSVKAVSPKAAEKSDVVKQVKVSSTDSKSEKIMTVLPAAVPSTKKD